MARRLQGCWPFRVFKGFSRRCRSRSFALHYRRKKYGSQWDFRPVLGRETGHLGPYWWRPGSGSPTRAVFAHWDGSGSTPRMHPSTGCIREKLQSRPISPLQGWLSPESMLSDTLGIHRGAAGAASRIVMSCFLRGGWHAGTDGKQARAYSTRELAFVSCER